MEQFLIENQYTIFALSFFILTFLLCVFHEENAQMKIDLENTQRKLTEVQDKLSKIESKKDG